MENRVYINWLSAVGQREFFSYLQFNIPLKKVKEKYKKGIHCWFFMWFTRVLLQLSSHSTENWFFWGICSKKGKKTLNNYSVFSLSQLAILTKALSLFLWYFSSLVILSCLSKSYGENYIKIKCLLKKQAFRHTLQIIKNKIGKINL